MQNARPSTTVAFKRRSMKPLASLSGLEPRAAVVTVWEMATDNHAVSSSSALNHLLLYS